MKRRASYQNARINLVWANNQWSVITTINGKSKPKRFEKEAEAELYFEEMLTKLRGAAAKNGGHVQCDSFRTLKNGELEVI